MKKFISCTLSCHSSVDAFGELLCVEKSCFNGIAIEYSAFESIHGLLVSAQIIISQLTYSKRGKLVGEFDENRRIYSLFSIHKESFNSAVLLLVSEKRSFSTRAAGSRGSTSAV